MTFDPGQIVDERFEIITRLGGNQVGSTSKARTLDGDREVVIKKLHRQTDDGMELQLQKAQAAQQLSQMCDEILTVEEVAVHEQDVFQVLPLLPSRSLRRQQPPKPQSTNQDDAPLYFREDFDWLTRVARALDFLAEQDTIHGDVKPNQHFV